MCFNKLHNPLPDFRKSLISIWPADGLVYLSVLETVDASEAIELDTIYSYGGRWVAAL